MVTLYRTKRFGKANLIVVLDALAGHEGGAAIGELNDDWRVDLSSRLFERENESFFQVTFE